MRIFVGKVYQQPKLCPFLAFTDDFWTISIVFVHTKQETSGKMIFNSHVE